MNSDTESGQEGETALRKRKVKKNKKYRDDSISPPPILDEGIYNQEILSDAIYRQMLQKFNCPYFLDIN